VQQFFVKLYLSSSWASDYESLFLENQRVTKKKEYLWLVCLLGDRFEW